MSNIGLSKTVRIFSLSLLIIITLSCRDNGTLFQKINSSQSKIYFNNQIVENDSINQLDIENVYNGGGVGIGDFNNDGLPDIFFTGNVVPCKLYLNEGNLSFKDVSAEANIDGKGKWCRGVAIIDINNDGLQDIYISATLKKNPIDRKNLLYINLGLNKNNIPTFKEEAAAYGLDDDSHTTQASFFDYDNDDDLDVYLTVNVIHDKFSPYHFRPVLTNNSNPSTGKLLRNDWNDSLNHPLFTDVSEQAGIHTEGYGHSASITDINNDGWKDIFVANDFLTNDLLWINNQNGTFTDMTKTYFKHTAANSMGNDIGDINNDGLMDVITLDMNPEDNYRKKMMLNPGSYQQYQNTERYDYSYQYVRNTLQLNQGKRILKNDSIGDPVFSEIGYYAGISATDWSWTPLLNDFDNDGYRDLIVCNGFPKDITDHDFATFRSKAHLVSSKDEILMQVPEVKLHNYAFKNNRDLTFSDVSDLWGMSTATFSNGAAYADLDKDGDMDLIINNINDEASLYRNNSREINKETSHYIHIQLAGNSRNKNGVGTWIEIYYDDGKKQVWENNPFRGYLSTIENIAHFGLGKVSIIDSILVKWQNGKIQVLKNLPADQLITADIVNAHDDYLWDSENTAINTLFTDVSSSVNISFTHDESDFVDFNIQKLIPHKFSEYGPSMAAGDIDGNGLDDIISGGSAYYSAQIFLQQANGKFNQNPLLSEAELKDKAWDDTGILLFDADSDGDMDIYVTSGGSENEHNTIAYQDHLYSNNGTGKFTEQTDALPDNYTSKFCVRSSDFDNDGDLDLFVAGRVDPGYYPKPVSSLLLRNDSEPGNIMFTDITQAIAEDLINIGLISDALFSDFDNDGWMDLVLAGEWMPVTMLKNEKGTFKNITPTTGISNKTGWWSSISAGDFDNDGDTDYVLGNLGQNSFYKASEQYPVSIYADDFDNNGIYDAFPTMYFASSQDDRTKKEFPVHTRDDAIKQMLSMRSKFLNYKSYAIATIDQLISKDQIKHSLTLKANYFSSSYCRNEGNGTFSLIPLPAKAQFSVLNGMSADDFDGDGNLDLIATGNDWGTDVTIGRYDALNGLVLIGDGKGNFVAQSISESGIYLPGNGKALIKLKGNKDSYLIATSQNRGPLKIFELNRKTESVPLRPDDVSAVIKYTDGTTRKLEFYYGNSFLSQSARFIITDEKIKYVIISNSKGQKREIDI
jgi:ASPIC and UnbV/FG-GAP-like repeat